mmetsp:Transcript_75010/g.139969  ORF Transcript_75010/g.139969 Transcript_75010/m.139969 type:complete len:287 (-) Transcript_75010:124-984(-)
MLSFAAPMQAVQALPAHRPSGPFFLGASQPSRPASLVRSSECRLSLTATVSSAILLAASGRRRRTRCLASQQSRPSSRAPLQCTLPDLTALEEEHLRLGLPVQRQERKGRDGEGLFITNVHAPASLVLERLSSFESYPNMIPVVREAKPRRGAVHSPEDGVLMDYKVSRFGLSVAALQRVDHEKGIISFDLDESVAGGVLKAATGYWRVESLPDGNTCRVWLSVRLSACRLLPTFLVDYAAERALRRATTWLRPYMEKLSRRQRMLGGDDVREMRGERTRVLALHV